MASAWARRAAWSGYTRALQLQSAEIDEIDVFSWGCGLQIPGRPLRSTNLDLFDGFPAWEAALRDPDPLAWRDALPTAIGEIEIAADHSPLIRALDRVRQHARLDSTALPADAWISYVTAWAGFNNLRLLAATLASAFFIVAMLRR